jgi:hypothetical protein
VSLVCMRARQSTVFLKPGMLCDVELRWNTTSFVSQPDPGGICGGFGDASELLSGMLSSLPVLNIQSRAYPPLEMSQS